MRTSTSQAFFSKAKLRDNSRSVTMLIPNLTDHKTLMQLQRQRRPCLRELQFQFKLKAGSLVYSIYDISAF